MRLPQTTRQEFRYGLSTFGKSLPWASAEAFSLYFLTDAARLGALRAGSFVLLFFLWNALCDPLVGWLLDRRAGPLPRRYYVIGTIAWALFFVLSFTFVAAPGASLLLLISGCAFRTAYAAVDVPHNALISRLGDTSRPRLGFSAARQIAGLAATFVVTFAARPLLQAAGPAVAWRFVPYAAGIALAGGVLFLIFFPTQDTRETAHADPDPEEARPQARGEIRLAIAAIMLTAMAGALVAGAFSKDVVYIAKYVFDDPAWTVDALTALMIGRFLGVPMWWLAPPRIGLPLAIALAWFLLAGAGAILSWLPADKRVFQLGMVAVGVGIGGINALTWAIIPHLAHRLASHRGVIADIRIFGLFTAATKVAGGMSGLLLGLVLASVGITGNAPIGAGQGARFYTLACLIPVLSAVAGFVLLLGYVLATRDRRPAAPQRLSPDRSV